MKSPFRSNGPCTLSTIEIDAISSTPPRQFCVTEATRRFGCPGPATEVGRRLAQLQLHRLPGAAQRLHIGLAVDAAQRVEQELLADLDAQARLELRAQRHRRRDFAGDRRHALAEPEHLAVPHLVQATGQRHRRMRERLRAGQAGRGQLGTRRVQVVVTDAFIEGPAVGEARRETAAALAQQPFVHGLEQAQADAPMLETTFEILLSGRHPLTDVGATTQRRDHRARQQTARPHEAADAPAGGAQIGADARRPLRRDPRDRQHRQHGGDRHHVLAAAPMRRDEPRAGERRHPHDRQREGLRGLRQSAAPQPGQSEAEQDDSAVDQVGALGHEIDQQSAEQGQQQRRQRRQRHQRPLLSARPRCARGRHREQHRDTARQCEQGAIATSAEEHPGGDRGTDDHAGRPRKRHRPARTGEDMRRRRPIRSRRVPFLAALHRPQQRAKRHAGRHRQIDTARERRQRRVERQQHHRQRHHEAQRAALPHRPQHREGQAQRQRAIQRRSADVHLPEQRGRAVVR
ncbi:hypothetical protein ACFJIX_05305 [Roseateles sp. UC29_93]|uniref:hypothetical protein n=1 Tax=Roseateles sp. UC29_93 TaxID=3350177 RepID=UPI00366BD65B